MSSGDHMLQDPSFASNGLRHQVLSTFSLLTEPPLGEQKRQDRLQHFLRDPESEISPGWFMHVPSRFNDALDLRQTERIENGIKKTVWTQGGNFSFKPGDMIHDNENGYRVWGEALRHLRFTICVTHASNVIPAQKGTERSAGSVTFQLLEPNDDRTQMKLLKSMSLTQDGFVRLLITGEGLPQTARINQGSPATENHAAIEYALRTRPVSTAGRLPMAASNRQKKLLRFFGIRFSNNITTGAAGWEIASLMSNLECRDRWRRYLFLTRDFGSETSSLKPYDEATLQSVQIPEQWSLAEEMRHIQEELVDSILSDESPYDKPQPAVSFEKRTFVFTGKFAFGTRKACQDAVLSRGGFAPDQKSVSRSVDYLVIGTEGSTRWRRGEYGNKIEGAIIARRDHGSPAIISEAHWVAALNARDLQTLRVPTRPSQASDELRL